MLRDLHTKRAMPAHAIKETEMKKVRSPMFPMRNAAIKLPKIWEPMKIPQNAPKFLLLTLSFSEASVT